MEDEGMNSERLVGPQYNESLADLLQMATPPSYRKSPKSDVLNFFRSEILLGQA